MAPWHQWLEGMRRSGMPCDGEGAHGRAVVRWSYDNGYSSMTTDWRMSNLEASRFWPRRGFRETFLRLYRSIP